MGSLENRARLAGKTAAVLGGGNGIGQAVSLALAEAGVDLVILDRNEAALASTSEAVKALGRRVVPIVGDVIERADVDRFYSTVQSSFDALDIAINLAGGTRQRDFLEGTEEEDSLDMRRNLGYVIQSIRHAARLMVRGGRGGSIINFTTIEAHRGAASYSVYAAAKAGTSNLTRALAVELGAQGIRVNELAPDTTPSEGNLNAVKPGRRERLAKAGYGDTASREALAKGALQTYIPLGVPPSTEALADAVLFLASDLAASITGVTLHVDGGTGAAMGFLRWPHGDGFGPTPSGISGVRVFLDGPNAADSAGKAPQP